MDCLLVADDLTGACDSAAPFASRGVRSLVRVAGRANLAGVRLLAVSTESRDLSPADIQRALDAVAAEYPADSAARVFKKIDSTMRGNTGFEIAAAMSSFGCSAAVVCPAFPAMRRVVDRGVLRVTNAPGFAPIDVPGRLSLQSGRECVQTSPGDIAAMLAQGARIVSVDADCDGQLDQIAASLWPMGRRVLWAGSAGLASALARLLGGTRRLHRPAPQGGAALFCIGSDHAVTLAQQDALLSGRPSVLLQPPGGSREAIREALVRGEHVVLRIPRGRISAGQVRERISGVPAAALVLSGGDTASLVCRALAVQTIELCDEIVVGLPRGIIHGGEFDGIPVAAKSGGFGERDALIRVADYFTCPNRPLRTDQPLP